MAASVLRRVTSACPRGLTMAEACRGGVERVAAVLGAMPGGVEAFLDSGPVRHPRYTLLAADIHRLMRAASHGKRADWARRN